MLGSIGVDPDDLGEYAHVGDNRAVADLDSADTYTLELEGTLNKL